VVIQEVDQLIDVFRFQEVVQSAPRQLGECFFSGHKDSEWAVLWVIQDTVELSSLDCGEKCIITRRASICMRDSFEDCSIVRTVLARSHKNLVDDMPDTIGRKGIFSTGIVIGRGLEC